MNSLSNQTTKESLSSLSEPSKKRKTEEESVDIIPKRRKTVQQESNFVSFIRNIIPFFFSMFKKNQDIVMDISDTESDSNSCTEVDKNNPLVLLYDRISIYRNDLNCLEEGNFLNDKIIDFMLCKLRNKYGVNQTYVFDSMFYIKLRDIQDPKDYYIKTSRWFKKKSLSNKNIWVIPVCDKYHWYVITVVYPETSRPQILVLDSCKRDFYISVNIIKVFLRQKFIAEHERNIDDIKIQIVNIPQQNNSYDCGLYALRSAELFMTEYAPHYTLLKLSGIDDDNSLNQVYEHAKLLTRNEIIRYLIDILKEQL